MSRPTIALIAAITRNRAIGQDNHLIWQESEDQKHFRRVTFGHAVLMGRKTWESLPPRFRPLPGRRNVVLSHDPLWRAEGAETASSAADALALLGNEAKVFVIGGAELFALFLPTADELVLTEVDVDLPGDAFFPDWPRDRFEVRSREARVDGAGRDYAFLTYGRKEN